MSLVMANLSCRAAIIRLYSNALHSQMQETIF